MGEVGQRIYPRVMLSFDERWKSSPESAVAGFCRALGLASSVKTSACSAIADDVMAGLKLPYAIAKRGKQHFRKVIFGKVEPSALPYLWMHSGGPGKAARMHIPLNDYLWRPGGSVSPRPDFTVGGIRTKSRSIIIFAMANKS